MIKTIYNKEQVKNYTEWLEFQSSEECTLGLCMTGKCKFNDKCLDYSDIQDSEDLEDNIILDEVNK